MLIASFQINPAPATLMLPLASFGWILYLILALSICGAPVVAEADSLVSERWRRDRLGRWWAGTVHLSCYQSCCLHPSWHIHPRCQFLFHLLLHLGRVIFGQTPAISRELTGRGVQAADLHHSLDVPQLPHQLPFLHLLCAARHGSLQLRDCSPSKKRQINVTCSSCFCPSSWTFLSIINNS